VVQLGDGEGSCEVSGQPSESSGKSDVSESDRRLFLAGIELLHKEGSEPVKLYKGIKSTNLLESDGIRFEDLDRVMWLAVNSSSRFALSKRRVLVASSIEALTTQT